MFKLSLSYCKKAAVLLSLMLLFSCATTSQRTSESESHDIVITENYGVDVEVSDKFNKAVELLDAKKYKEAIKLLLEVTGRTKQHSAPYVNLGIAYLKTGKIEEAEKSLLAALKINPNHPVTNNELAIIYRKSGRFSEAKKIYEQVVENHPQFLPARKNLGILCDLFMGDLDCAIKHYDAYLNLQPDDKQVNIWLLDLKQRTGKI